MSFRILLLFAVLVSCSYLHKAGSPVSLEPKKALDNETIVKELKADSLSKLQKPSISFSLELKKEQSLNKGTVFKGLKVGGLSELAFDTKTGRLTALSDDKKNHRWYELSFQTKPEYQVKIIKQIFLKSPNSKKLNQNMDPEALLFYGDEAVFIASEGQQIYRKHDPTQIFTFNRKGVLKEAWPVPSVFWQFTPNRRAGAIGQQENKGFESLTLDKNKQLLWTATEKPLKQDLIFKHKSFVRLTAFDIKNKTIRFQYPYFLQDPKDGGLTALEFLKDNTFISLERAYKRQKKNGANEVQLFLTDCQKAQDIQAFMILRKNFKACSKTLLWSSSQEKNIKVDNLEGLALSQLSADKKRTLILVSDDNFNPKNQKTQFLFFDLIEK